MVADEPRTTGTGDEGLRILVRRGRTETDQCRAETQAQMSLRSVWTIQAEAAYNALLRYWELEWGPMVADAFRADVAHTIALLEVFPDAGVMERRTEQIRSIPVARQVRLFY
jgi:plasmid stabilization system protein ParE